MTIKTKEKILKLVIKPSEIEQGKWGNGFTLGTNNNILCCQDCKSVLFYNVLKYAVLEDDDFEFQVMGNRSVRTYSLRETGMVCYCAECGNYVEDYHRWFYPKDKIVFEEFVMDELDEWERAELENCLHQWNQKGDFVSRIKSHMFDELKIALIKYEKKYPIKEKIKVKKKK